MTNDEHDKFCKAPGVPSTIDWHHAVGLNWLREDVASLAVPHVAQ
jgi:hypothetical protein